LVLPTILVNCASLTKERGLPTFEVRHDGAQPRSCRHWLKAWGKAGAFWGGIWGLLFGSAFFWIPGLGPTLVAGPLVSLIVGALENAAAVGVMSAACAGLFAMGIPDNSILRYETALKAGKFVLIAHGTLEEAIRAKEILGRGKPDSLDHHQ